MREDHKLPDDSECLKCGKKVDAATCVNAEAHPKPNDITMCIYCGHFMAFGDDLRPRELAAWEEAVISNHPDVIKAKEALKLYNQNKGRLQ